ncbi:MAG: transposase [Bacteroidota bacterium]
MKNLFWLIAFSFGLTLLACSGGSKEETQQEETAAAAEDAADAANSAGENQPTNMADAMQQAQEAMKGLQGGKTVEPINFRQLQELLPENAAGFERINKSGETSGAAGMTISVAKGDYKKGDATVDLNVMDTGGMGLAMLSMAAWTTIVVDKEDDNGYERTSKLDGYKSYEKYEKGSGRSELAVIVGDRFLVTANGNAEMDDLKKLVKGVDLGKLANMK